MSQPAPEHVAVLRTLIGKEVLCLDGLRRRLLEVVTDNSIPHVRYEFHSDPGDAWAQPGNVPIWQAITIFSDGDIID